MTQMRENLHNWFDQAFPSPHLQFLPLQWTHPSVQARKKVQYVATAFEAQLRLFPVCEKNYNAAGGRREDWGATE